MKTAIGRLFHHRRGAALAELALVIPLFTVLIFGVVEFGRLLLAGLKLDRAAATAADLVAQSRSLDEAMLAELLDAARLVADPFNLPAGGRLVVSGIGLDAAGSPRLHWQRCSGNGAKDARSGLGAQGGPAKLPAGFTLRPGETLIAAEIFFDFQPMFLRGPLNVAPLPQRMAPRAFYRSRFGTLTTVNPGPDGRSAGICS